MRIALVADTFSVTEGTGIARYAEELRAGLTSRGVTVEPITPRPPRLPFGLALNHALRMPYLVARKAAHFDVVHAASPITALGFPLVRKPKVVTYHDLVSLLCRNTSSAFHTRLFAPLFLRAWRFADRIIAISWQTKGEMLKHLGVPSSKVSVVNYGVSEVFRPVHVERADEFVIGYVGAFNRRKGVDYLFRAYSALRAKGLKRRVKLVLCGGKDLEYDALRQLATDLNIDDHVEFRGFVGGESLARAYTSFDVFVLPSEWEGFGLPILEAQRCGVPVIIRADAHIPAEVSVCCLRASSEEDTADKIHRLLTDDTFRGAVVQEGLEHSQQFTWERTVQQTMEVYEQALARR
jgi:glycosyltransferase involved in cell wall biosynthesis